MNEVLNPNDFVISRKRKKYKFAKFFNSTLCYEFDEWKKQSVDVIEMGAGTGLFSVELATRYPEKTFVAIDIKGDRLQKGAYEAEARGLKNVRFLRARADQIDDLFPKNHIGVIWLTFPDPFPRDRSARRRMTHPLYLEKYAALLKPEGEFYLKHDNPTFFSWSLEQLVAENWIIRELSFDLHESELNYDYKIKTTYEIKWLDEGLKTNFVKATKGK